jgi:pyruvate/2-oxoglutarate/acetoin dehydrogenase E1 component
MMLTVLESLNAALHRAFKDNDRVILLGEDVLDPYGGAFKVTRGLSSAFPDRVWTTPISEGGIVGLGAGLALRGLRPVVEIMFGDFVTLAADQLINHATKFRWMYNDQVRVPLVVRTPMGGRRGYGPTHSQTLEKLFLGVPGLQVLAPAAIGDPGELLYRSILDTEDPVLFIENKLLYLSPVLDAANLAEFDITQQLSHQPPHAPTFTLTVRGAPPPWLTMVAYGDMADLARKAQLNLAYEYECFTELIIPARLAPCEPETIIASANRTGYLLTIEEGTLSFGWGSEIITQCCQALDQGMRKALRLAAQDLPVPASGPLEEAVLPKIEDIIQAALSFSNKVNQ